MPLPTYLQLIKNGWYRYRRTVPVDVCTQFKKKIYIACLHTRQLEEAKRLSHIESVAFDEKVARIRAINAKRAKKKLKTSDIEHVSARFEALLLYGDEVERSAKLTPVELLEHKAFIRQGAAETAEALYAQDPTPFLDSFEEFAESEGVSINPKWGHFERFAMSMLTAQARAFQALEERISGKIVQTPDVPPIVSTEDDMDIIANLVAYWKEHQHVKVKTAIEVNSVVKRLREFANVQRVSQIDDTLPGKFRDWLLKHGNRRQMKPGQVGTPLRVATVKKILRLLSAAIQCAVDNKKLNTNPLARLRFPHARDTIDAEPFTVEQLNQIYESPIYTQRYRPVGGAGEAAFWLPLFGLFTGGRETELGQPLLADIRCERGIYFIDVTDKAEAQSVKNQASKRRIPLHSQLIEIGFLDYVNWLKEQGETRLFPKLNPDCKGGLLGNWSKWFNRYLDKIVGINERGLNFHTLRHSLKYFGRVSEMEEELLDRLQGHTPSTAGSKYGGLYPLGPLSKTLEMLKVEGLDIAHIRWMPPTGNELQRLSCK